MFILEDRHNSDKHQFHHINLQSSPSRGAIGPTWPPIEKHDVLPASIFITVLY